MVLLEITRQRALSKSKSFPKGKERFNRSSKSLVGNSVSQFNKIDMSNFFKNDTLIVNVDVRGETDDYLVTMRFEGVLKELQLNLKQKSLNLGLWIKTLSTCFNKEDLKIRCTCKDFQYRFSYWTTVNQDIEGQRETRPSDKTNPNDELGVGCKHILLVLKNNSWLVKVASVLNNYVKYMEKFRITQYDSVIYPAIYGEIKDVQMSIFDKEGEVPELTKDMVGYGKQVFKDSQFKKGEENPRYNPNKSQEQLPGQQEI